MKMLADGKIQDIRLLLEDLERRYKITIIHAVESGSRAWGFPSRDSDYDIRFIYAHPWHHYLTAFEKKDQMQLASYGDLDGAGWDIAKCLRLLYRGNAALYEWLGSPIVYHTRPEIQHLREHARQIFNPAPAFYHYLSLAKKKLLDERVERHPKTFLYGLRSLLCAAWIVDKSEPAPVWFPDLVQRYLPQDLQAALGALLEEKYKSAEQDAVGVEPELLQWAKDLFRQQETIEVRGTHYGDITPYDQVLHRVLGVVGTARGG